MRLSFLKNNRFQLFQYFDSDITIPKYTVIWKNWDGTVIETDEGVLEGGLPAFNSQTPTKASTQTIRYEFDGWEPSVTHATGDAVYTAKFREVPITYQISWLNYDGSLIKMEEVNAGTKPSYSGATPAKPSTTQYRYEFNGWTPMVEAAYADASYTATFNELPNTITVTFVRDSADGGGTLDTQTVNYGETPVFSKAEPTTIKGAAPNFTFAGWKPELGPVTENTTFVAVFNDNNSTTVKFIERTLTEYISDVEPILTEANVTWKNWDGTILEFDRDVPIGVTPTYNGAEPVLAGWDKPIVPLTGYTVYTAIHYTLDDNGRVVLYSLPSARSFNGDNYISTSIKLMNTPKQFTIVYDILDQSPFSFSSSQKPTVFHCMHESSPWPGTNEQFASGNGSKKSIIFAVNGSAGKQVLNTSGIMSSGTGRMKLVGVIDTINGTAKAWRYIDGTTYSSGTIALNEFVPVDEELILGAYQTTDGTKGRLWTGTMYDFKVYGCLLTDEEALAYLAEDHS